MVEHVKQEDASVRPKMSFAVTGMTCATCVRIVERSLKKVPGVAFAAVNLATETAFVVLDREVPFSELEAAVENVGYHLSRESPVDAEKTRYAAARTNVLVAWGATAPLMLLMALHMTGRHVPFYLPVEVIGAAAAILLSGRQTLKGAWIALTHAHSNMDVLVSLGAIAAWSTSLLSLSGVRIQSFGAIGAMIVALHVTGRFIESHLRDRAVKAIRALAALQPREARVLDSAGAEILIPIDAVASGATAIVRPGERIPADGTILKGRTSVDESMITGEPIPVPRGPDDAVTGGALNLSGEIRFLVTATGEDSFLSQMLSLVREAQGAKVPIQAFADRVTNVFVPAIAIIAVSAAAAWYFEPGWFTPLLDWVSAFIPWTTAVRDPASLAAFVFVSTIVIACPCALGLATPMALITGTGAASRLGLIIRNAEAIQTARDVGIVVVDKTGTVTEGTPSIAATEISREDLEAAAALEARSNHPLARAIAAATHGGRVVADVEEIAGEGVGGTVDGVRYFVGRPSDATRHATELELGRTVVEVRRDDVAVGWISVEDRIREDSRPAVARLRDAGIRVVMATGDEERTAEAVAKRVGIDEFHARVRPADKLSLVRRLQTEGRKVLMVGDGLNDAAALKGADIGVAVGSGTDLAIESADIVIVRGGLSRVADGIEISRKTFSVIRQNLFWAFAYNVVAVPLAALGLLNPLIAESAMAMSSISVILNSMRIR
jgi:Cu+-exporting ATPase